MLFKGTVLLLSCSLFLSASCSDGGSDLPERRPVSTVLGVAHDAPLVSAPVEMYSWSGSRGDLLTVGTTSSTGEYRFELSAPDQSVYIKAGGGGSYTEENSGKVVTLEGGQYLSALAFHTTGENITFQVTPYTHLATCYAEYLIDQNYSVFDAITIASSAMGAMAGTEIIKTKPIDLTNADSLTATPTSGHKYGLLTAGVSTLMAKISRINGIEPHSLNYVTSINWAALGCRDIRADGVLDGKDAGGQIALGMYLVTTATYREELALSMLEFLDTDRNKSGLTIEQMYGFADSLSASGQEVFGGEVGQKVDIVGPSITANFGQGTYISGESEIAFTIADPIGVTRITFYDGDTELQTGDGSQSVLFLAAGEFPDGELTITIEAEDSNANVSSVDYRFTVDNTGVALNLTSMTLVNNALYTITGTAQSVGSDVDRIEVGGVEAVLVDGNWSLEVELVAGVNSLTVVGFDMLNNQTDVDYLVGYDNRNPVIKNSASNIVFFSNIPGQLSDCFIGTFSNTGAESPVCMQTNKVSLDGTEISSTLSNDGFTAVELFISDPLTNDVATSSEDINVTYKYTKGGDVVINWTQLTTHVGGGLYILPLTTEFLGDTWYQTTINEEHVIDIVAVDQAGNTSVLSYSLKFDVLIPPLFITEAYSGDSELNRGFSTRSDASLLAITL